MSIDKIDTPTPPQRKYPQEEPDSGNNKGIQQKPDTEKKEKKEQSGK